MLIPELSMDALELEVRLRQSAQSDDPPWDHRLLIEELEQSGAGIEAVEPILRFMEEHPLLELGVPGSLVHFVETFADERYEPLLLASLRRRPTSHTVWMLNRVINGKKSRVDRLALCVEMGAARNHPLADDETRLSAQEFLDLHNDR